MSVRALGDDLTGIGYGIPISVLDAGVARGGVFYSTDDNAGIVDLKLFLLWRLKLCLVVIRTAKPHVLLPFSEPRRL